MWVADTHNNRVRVIDGGIITTVAGGGSRSGDGFPATLASFFLPTDVALGADGATLYILDRSNHRLVSVGVDGLLVTVAGVGGSGGFSGDGGRATAARLNYYPTGFSIGGDGTIYVADTFNQRVRAVAPNGTIATIAGNGVEATAGDGGPATAASLREPVAVAVDGAGNVFVAEYFGNRVRRVQGAG